MHKIISLLLVTAVIVGCNETKKEISVVENSAVTEFLRQYNIDYQQLLAVSSAAEWKLNTYLVKGDTVTKAETGRANEALAAFTGGKSNIEKARFYLENDTTLTPIQQKQLEVIIYKAGANPEVAGDLVKRKIAAETAQTENMFTYVYKIAGKEVDPNAINKTLRESDDLAERLKYWECSKGVGAPLKAGLANLRDLRNGCVQALGYDDYFGYQVSEYGMSTQEMMDVCAEMNTDVWPLYRELHTWARYTLAEKYKQEVPEMLPAHWLTNKWGQDWLDMVEVEGVDLNGELEKHGPEWIVEKGEDFYTSLGFPALPKTFHEKSSLYPASLDAGFKKNTHASAWHMNNADDVRSLMSIEANTEWWGTTLHELGHIYYYMTYSNNDVPIILREGANRAYHEAMGSLMGLAAMQKPFLEEMGLMKQGTETDEIQTMLKEALDYIVLIPWGAGVMPTFEKQLYADNLSKDEFNKAWWAAKYKYQGIVPPSDRGEEFCDAATKTHINNDAAQYYDYAMSNVLLFQFHIHIANEILKQDPHATNYYGSKEVGEFLQGLMYPGGSVDWREHLKQGIGQDMSAKPMVEYFDPLYKWLQEQNKERTHTLREKF